MSTVQVAPSIDLIEKAWAEHVEREYWRGTPEPHDYLYAGSRRRCLRRSVLECTRPEMMPQFDSDTKARMIRGDDRERDISTDLARVGRLCEPSFRPIGQQETIRITDRKGRLVIKGKIDGKIQWASREVWPFEVKNWSPFLTEKIYTFADLYNNVWTWSGAHQLLSYLYATNQPHGLLILDRSGLPRLIQVNLEENLEQMEAFLHDATVCIDHIEAGTLPDFIRDFSECKRCPFMGSACQPPSYEEGAEIIVDESVIQMVERYADLHDVGEEYKALDKAVKEKFRGTELAIVGKTLLEGKWQQDTKYKLPDVVKTAIEELKAPYAEKVAKGKFFLTVTKV